MIWGSNQLREFKRYSRSGRTLVCIVELGDEEKVGELELQNGDALGKSGSYQQRQKPWVYIETSAHNVITVPQQTQYKSASLESHRSNCQLRMSIALL